VKHSAIGMSLKMARRKGRLFLPMRFFAAWRRSTRTPEAHHFTCVETKCVATGDRIASSGLRRRRDSPAYHRSRRLRPGEKTMPYIRDRDFARIRELVQTTSSSRRRKRPTSLS